MIGEDQAEMLDYVPAQFRVRLIRRPRYGCRACENAVVQAPAPDRPIDGGMATEALVAQVLISKYGDHLPLYRQSQIFARQGIELDRSTLCNWVGRACWWLAPLHELMLSTVLSSPKVFADDTTLPVLDPGNGRTKTGRLWCYAVDNRPWQGPGHPVAAYAYSEDRKAEHPASHLKGFRGLLQVDGYAGFGSLVKAATDGGLQLAFCWAHTRRKFYDVHVATKSPLAEEALRRIAELYAIEADIRGQTADERRTVRQERSRPLVEAMHAWLTRDLGPHLRPVHLGPGHPLCAQSLERIDPVPGRWSPGAGYQHCRAGHTPGCAGTERTPCSPAPIVEANIGHWSQR